MEYSIIIEKNPTTGVYVGQCSQLPEAMSQGNTLAELMANMKEAIELAIECRRDELKELYKNRKVFHRRLTVNAWRKKNSWNTWEQIIVTRPEDKKAVTPNFINQDSGKRTIIPLHNDIDDILAKKICKQLGIPLVGNN